MLYGPEELGSCLMRRVIWIVCTVSLGRAALSHVDLGPAVIVRKLILRLVVAGAWRRAIV